jgi:tetratricopeptide (TPR) repeat protein
VSSKTGLVLAWLLLPAAAAPAAEQDWVAVRSPHLTVFCQGTEKAARRIALQLEAISDVFARFGLPAGATRPVRVFAVPNEAAMKALLPSRGREWTPSGFFQAGGPNHTIAIRMDADPDVIRHIVFHEYVHLLNRQTMRRLPTWLSEGLAELYATVEVDKDSVIVGRVSSWRHGTLSGAFHVPPLERLFALDRYSRELDESYRAGVFYAQAGLFTHYLVLGKKGVYRPRLAEYIRLIEGGMLEPDARRKAFGDLKKLEEEFTGYRRQPGLPGLAFKGTLDESHVRTLPITDAQALSLVAEFLAQTGELAAARKKLDEARKLDPKVGLGYRVEARLLEADGKIPEAVAALEKAIADSAKDFSAQYHLGLVRAREETAESRKRREAALRRAIEMQPAYAPGPAALAELLTDDGRCEEAVAQARRATELEPRELSHGLGLARAHRACKKEKEADALEAQLVEDSRNDPDDMQHLAAYFRKEGRPSEVEKHLRAARAAQPGSVGILIALASVLGDDEKHDAAEEVLRAALKLRPNDARLLNDLAYQYADRNVRLEEALQLAEKALKREPNNPGILDTRGWVLYRLGSLKQAEVDLRKAVADEASPVRLAHLGDVLSALGRREDALAQWRLAMQTHGVSDELLAELTAKTGPAEPPPAP